MKSYSSSVVFIVTVLLVIICNVNIVRSSPFGLLGALSGSTQNAQNSITQGERNRSLEFVKTVLVTPLYGPGLSYKVGLLGRLFRQFSQIAGNQPGNAQNGIGLLPNSVSKTLHFNRGITVSSPTQNEASITHATISTTEISQSGIGDNDDDKAGPSKPDMEEKEVDLDLEKDEDKAGPSKENVEEKESDADDGKDSEKDADKEDDKDVDNDSDKDSKNEDIKAVENTAKDDDQDSGKDDDKDENKDNDSERELEKDTSVDKFKEVDFDLALNSPSIALIHSPTNSGENSLNANTVGANKTSSFSAQSSTNERSNFGNSNKNTNGGSNDKNSESSNISQSIAVSAKSINNLQANIGKNLTGSGGYHYAPRGYRVTRNGPTLIFEPSEVINTLTG